MRIFALLLFILCLGACATKPKDPNYKDYMTEAEIKADKNIYSGDDEVAEEPEDRVYYSAIKNKYRGFYTLAVNCWMRSSADPTVKDNRIKVIKRNRRVWVENENDYFCKLFRSDGSAVFMEKACFISSDLWIASKANLEGMPKGEQSKAKLSKEDKYINEPDFDFYDKKDFASLKEASREENDDDNAKALKEAKAQVESVSEANRKTKPNSKALSTKKPKPKSTTKAVPIKKPKVSAPKIKSPVPAAVKPMAKAKRKPATKGKRFRGMKKLSSNCWVRSTPNATNKSNRLYEMKGGKKLWVENANKDYAKVFRKGGKVAYMPKSCFGE